MNEFRFSLDLFKGSPCGSVWLLSSRAVRGGPPGEVRYYSLPSRHQTIGDALAEGGPESSSLLQAQEGGQQVSPTCKTEIRVHCMLSFLNGLITIYKIYILVHNLHLFDQPQNQKWNGPLFKFNKLTFPRSPHQSCPTFTQHPQYWCNLCF